MNKKTISEIARFLEVLAWGGLIKPESKKQQKSTTQMLSKADNCNKNLLPNDSNSFTAGESRTAV